VWSWVFWSVREALRAGQKAGVECAVSSPPLCGSSAAAETSRAGSSTAPLLSVVRVRVGSLSSWRQRFIEVSHRRIEPSEPTEMSCDSPSTAITRATGEQCPCSTARGLDDSSVVGQM
jgi:hypothetical protein